MKISLNTLTRKKSVIFRIAYRSITGSSSTPAGQSPWYPINRLGAGFIYNHITSKSPRHWLRWKITQRMRGRALRVSVRRQSVFIARQAPHQDLALSRPTLWGNLENMPVQPHSADKTEPNIAGVICTNWWFIAPLLPAGLPLWKQSNWLVHSDKNPHIT